MTTYSKSTLATFFQTGDVPDGADYSNLIDSQVNIVETSVQAMGGALQTPELITPRVSAGNVNVTGTLTVTGTYSAATVNAATLNAGAVSAGTINATGTLAVAGVTTLAANTSAQAMWVDGNFIRPVVTIVASGTTIGTANLLTGQISRLITVSDGTATGVALQANKTGLTQYLYNETATSANLYPCVGGQINVLASSAPFALAGSTLYTIVHTKASGYAVK